MKLDNLLENERDKPLLMHIQEVESTLRDHLSPYREKPRISAYSRWTLQQSIAGMLILAVLIAGLGIAYILSLDRVHVDRFNWDSYAAVDPDLTRELFSRWDGISQQMHNIPESSGFRLIGFQAESVPVPLKSKLTADHVLLSELGISFPEGNIQFEGNISGSGYLRYTVHREHRSVSLSDNPQPGVIHLDFLPLFVTDEFGRHGPRYTFSSTNGSYLMSDQYFYQIVNELVPVQITSPAGQTIVFWFRPTHALMNLIEANIGAPLTAESADSTVEDTSPEVAIELFPNPVVQRFSLYASLSKEDHMSIDLLDISGKTVKSYVKNITLERGSHRLSFDMKDLDEGLYFLKIQTDEEEYFRRIFKV